MSKYPSNTAAPKYYTAFRNKVLSGKHPVCLEISLEMNRIDRLIADPNYHYDPRPVEAFIRFCEAELTKTDGSELQMLDSFKLWAEQLFGWYYWSTWGWRTCFTARSERTTQEFYWCIFA